MDVEARVVGPTDAVVDPGTVMVISLDTAIANVTVAALWQSNDLAKRAERLWVKCFHQRDELDLFAALYIARA